MSRISTLSKKVRVLIVIIISTIIFSIIAPSTRTFAVSNDGAATNAAMVIDHNQAEIEHAFSKMVDYINYDYKTKTYSINHEVVKNGALTEAQYHDALVSLTEWQQVEHKYMQSSSMKGRVLPVLLAAAIAAVGTIVGTVIVSDMTHYFLTWGLKSGCKKFKKYGLIKSFCKANDLL